MKLSTTTAVVVLAGVASAQVSAIPQCALQCFTTAVGMTSCALTDFYCQCSKGAKTIASSAFACLCNDSTCSASDIQAVGKASNNICSSAYAASSKTYTPTPIPSNICNAAASGSASVSKVLNSASISASASAAMGGKGGKGGNGGKGGSKGGAASSSSAAAAASGNAGAGMNVGVTGAILGAGALGLFVL